MRVLRLLTRALSSIWTIWNRGNRWLATGYCSEDAMSYGCPLSEGEGAEALLIPGYRKALTAVTSAGVPPNRYATSTVSLISASVAPAARARLAMLATPSAWAVMASTIMVMRILYLAGMAPSCRMRLRCAMYDSANCASRCWRVWSHGGTVGWAISYLLCKHKVR